MVTHNRRYLKENRKQLRNNLTPAEAELWKHLKGGSLEEKKFRRQHSAGNYILDFYCPFEKLAIELDGQVHNNSAAEHADYERDMWLKSLNIRVLRFENKEVFDHLESVLQRIRSAFGK